MKLFCQYSGVSYTLPHLQMVKQPVLTVHPVFHLDKKQIFHLYSDWQEGVLETEQDSRLLFLAMLNSTALIDWRATANPTNALVQSNMPNLYYTAKWITSVQLPGMKLPRFAITNDTRSLDNIKHWLDIWEQIRDDFEAGYKTTSEIEKQKSREEMLEKLIKTGAEDASKFSGLLAQWAFEAAEVPANIRDYWRRILTSKGINIFSIPRVDMDEMVEHFEDALADHGSIYSFTVLKYVRYLQKQVITGLGFNINSSLDLVDVVTRSEFSIVDNSDITNTERLNIQKLINSAPDREPVESNYPSKVAYLRAKISWKMASKAAIVAVENQENLQRRVTDQLATDEIDNQINEEEGEGE